MEKELQLPANVKITKKQIMKMFFIFNSLENGWTVKKKGDNYKFTKKHEGKKEIFLDNYLSSFLEENFIMNQNFFVEE